MRKYLFIFIVSGYYDFQILSLLMNTHMIHLCDVNQVQVYYHFI